MALLALNTSISTAAAVVVNTGTVAHTNCQAVLYPNVLLPVPSCIKYIFPLCPAVQLAGAFKVLLPPRVTRKLFHKAKFTLTQAASVTVTIGL